MLRFNKFSGFTLAEVLITLGIIGVVASLTIPIIMNNSEKQTIISKVKEAYSILSQATTEVNNDCGGSIEGCVTSTTAANDNDDNARKEITNEYKKKLSLSKDCTDNSLGCVPNVRYKTLYPTATWNNVQADTRYDYARFILANGMSVAIRYHGRSLPSYYITIEVDINGLANPNQHGKDYFFFSYNINTRTLTPNNNADCVSAVSPNYGVGCSLRVIQEDAINYY